MTGEQGKALRARYGLPERYVLYHGTLEPRKNIPSLLKAYSIAKPRLGNVKLVISGKKGWLYESIFATVTNLGLQDDVFFPGYIENDDLPLLYNACEFFSFVSGYEGFGLPILEAMGCGKAVITSNVSSMPEVAGNAAAIVAPHDIAKLAEVMLRLHENEGYRQSLEKASLKRAAEFSWANTAKQTLAVLDEVARKGRAA